MSLRRALVGAAGRVLYRDFAARSARFGGGGGDRLARLNFLLARARQLLPAYDAACAAALGGRASLASPGELRLLPVMRRKDLRGYAAGPALARLASGGTSGGDRVETRLDLSAVVRRYAALLSVLEEAGWRMGEKIAALHPVEYGYFQNFRAGLSGGEYARLAFDFFQQYGLYRLVHNRVNVHYSREIFSAPPAAARLAEEAAAQRPRLLISRPDALMAVLKALRGAGLSFPGLRAVLTVGTALAESVRREAQERLGAPVFDMYASTELGYAALGCGAPGGRLHADGAAHILEAGPDGGLLCTDLDNALTPLLRYDTGDAAELAETSCGCGRSGLTLRPLGRRGKYAETAAGRLYEAAVLDRAFPSDLPFFQLDAASGRLLLPPGAGEREAAAVRELLGLRPGDYGAWSAGNFKISSSGKFCCLP